MSAYPKIVIYANQLSDYENLKNYLLQQDSNFGPIIFCDSKSQTRGEVICQFKNQWLYFLDSDCYPKPESLKHIMQLIKTEEKKSVVISGLYHNPSHGRYLQKVQNKISNVWLSLSYELDYKYKNLLGGNFLIFNKSDLAVESANVSKLFWGAEDLFLGHLLADNGFQFLKDEKIAVEHKTSYAFKHFIRRAWLHGVNEIKYIERSKAGSNRIKYFVWLRRFGSQDLFLFPAIFLHFCIQKLAKLTQIILQGRKIAR